jgi:ferredoxin
MSDEDRETMQQELMDLGVWLAEHPEAATKNLKPIRDRVVLDPGIYYNSGTGMIERIYAPPARRPRAQNVPHKQRPGDACGEDPTQGHRREGRVATRFLTATTVCIGCKACEVACKQWNQLPADPYSGLHRNWPSSKRAISFRRSAISVRLSAFRFG